jgi:GNAT superfamily N-acetyltransferase
VIEQNSKIIAYCFSRRWGTLGWIGPLSVIPTDEGKGFGKQIVGAAVDALKAAGAQTIGLEMAAHSNRNLAFYAKIGFVPNHLTVDLIRHVSGSTSKKVREATRSIAIGELPTAQREKHFNGLRELSEQLQRGLDYRGEVQLARDCQFGDARLLYADERLIGFILAHTESYSQEECREYLKVNALQMAPDLPLDTLDSFIAHMEDWARAENLSSLYLRVPTRYFKGLRFLLSHGFFVINSELRMTLENYPLDDDEHSINFNKWE